MDRETPIKANNLAALHQPHNRLSVYLNATLGWRNHIMCSIHHALNIILLCILSDGVVLLQVSLHILFLPCFTGCSQPILIITLLISTNTL